MLPVSAHTCATGSKISALESEGLPLDSVYPPAAKTVPFASNVAVCRLRDTDIRCERNQALLVTDSGAVPETAPTVAETVADPVVTPVAIPVVGPIVAIEVVSEGQLAALVTS